jgi:thiosulfate/3-mercaptopyruvate sulfurtransferase
MVPCPEVRQASPSPFTGAIRDRQVICYCGGGISATVDLFLLHQLGFDNLTLYDGSMGEWAKDSVLPIEKG